MSSFLDGLSELIEKFEDTRRSYRNFTRIGDFNRDSLIEFESRFVDIKADMRPYLAHVTGKWIERDDKSSTAIKFRIGLAIHEGKHEDFEECSINQAEKFASGSKEYKEFLSQRSFYKESLVNLTEIRDIANSYINEIKDRLKQ